MVEAERRGKLVQMALPARQNYTFAEYLWLEEVSPVKHEFMNGEVWAMAGGTPDHAAICVNVSSLLNVQLRGKPCRVYSSDLRVRVRATGLGTYPDVTVIYGKVETDPEDTKGHTAVNPRVIVEVMSPSTAIYDRGEKLEQYQRIDGLNEIVLVHHDSRLVEVFHSGVRGFTESQHRDGSVELLSIGCVLPFAEIYRDPLNDG